MQGASGAGSGPESGVSGWLKRIWDKVFGYSEEDTEAAAEEIRRRREARQQRIHNVEAKGSRVDRQVERTLTLAEELGELRRLDVDSYKEAMGYGYGGENVPPKGVGGGEGDGDEVEGE